MWRKGSILAALAILVAGCSENKWSDDALASESATVQQGAFFPQRITTGAGDPYRRSPVLDEFERDYYSAALLDAGEPPLPEIASAAPANTLHLRFIWIPSFHNPVIVRVTSAPNGDRWLVAKRLPSLSGESPARGSIERLLTREEARLVNALVEDSGILLESGRDTRMSGIDGARWVLEAADGKHYHLINRWSPDEGPVRKVGTAMLKLTGWQFEAIY
jgi:hypothetical protein